MSNVHSHQTLELVLLQTLPSCFVSVLLYTHIHFPLFLFFSWSFAVALLLSSSLPSLPAFFISDRAGLWDFSWGSNYLNFVWVRCVFVCMYVCVPKHVCSALFPAMSICHRILEAESVNHSASSSTSQQRVFTCLIQALINTYTDTQINTYVLSLLKNPKQEWILFIQFLLRVWINLPR